MKLRECLLTALFQTQLQLQPTHVVEVGLGGLGQLGGPGLARHLRVLISHLV